MSQRRWLWAVCWCVAAQPALAATSLSPQGNFLVTARRPEVAQQVARYAEFYRQQKALNWLGRELEPWTEPCTVEVRVTHGSGGGATSFSFDNGQILAQHMTVEGALERILDSVLPHEVTHTIFAAHFRRPLPRWADEGGAVLSEDYQEIARHDLLVRELINSGRMIPLRRLFVLTEYPNDVMALYAQGFSIARYLVALRGKREFLDFVWDGQTYGWEFALQRHYGFRRIQEAEDRWINWLIAGHGTGADQWSLAEAAPSTRRMAEPEPRGAGRNGRTAAASSPAVIAVDRGSSLVASNRSGGPVRVAPAAVAAIQPARPIDSPGRSAAAPGGPTRPLSASAAFSPIPSPVELAPGHVRASAYAASSTNAATSASAPRDPFDHPRPAPAARRAAQAPLPAVMTTDVVAAPATISPEPDPLMLPPKRIPIAVGRTRRAHAFGDAQ